MTSAKTVQVDGIVLTIPATPAPRCWKFQIVYACHCPVDEESYGLIRDKVIYVKHHSGPCWMRGCTRVDRKHVLSDKCRRCNVRDIAIERAAFSEQINYDICGCLARDPLLDIDVD
ncbi:hypothetical protein F4779DRAFT_620142 [Xylariaceae sp. FL0662B]|nr:hypothetical protein F4779DRAFT_620142 [Xylariaceae sp. FL0662B]